MKNRFFTMIMLLALLVSIGGSATAASAPPTDQRALVYVELGTADALSRFASTHLPLYSMLDAGLLTGADQRGMQSIKQAGLNYRLLDASLGSSSYYLAETRPSRPAPDFSVYGQVLLSIKNNVLLRMDPSMVDALTQAGAELRKITLTPKPLPAAQTENVFPDMVVPDPIIQGMMDQVSETQVYTYDRQLAGELPVWVDGAWYNITSRRTDSGTPIQKATSFVGQHMSNDLGLGVEYYQWNNATNPDVIGELPGLVNPENVFIIGGHIDDVQSVPAGADDNASGSVAALIAADIMSQYQWGCTLRFAFWTGEEQGLLGSAAYAQHVYNSGENIVGYLNLDMIAWNTPSSAPTIFLGYRSSVPGSLDLANLFSDVVDSYNINLQPVIGTGYDGSSDHTSFLDYGYPSILGIEGDDDFNPYYHTPQDTTAHTDPAYFTDFVKASVGTYAHMSGCLIPSGVGHLDGHVTAADGGAPLEGATVTADDGLGHAYPSTTDPSGYYTRTLMAGDYSVSASTYGYLPITISGVGITTDTVTTLDFALEALPTHVISGHLYDSVSGDPLQGTVQFTDAPLPPVDTDPNGFYTISVAEGTWHLKAQADMHMQQTQQVVVNDDLTVDFYLDPLPCILLVDDDMDDPDVRTAYTSALDNRGYGYNVWDVASQGNPAEADLAGYRQVLWFTGYPFSNTFNNDNEAAVGTYLDQGGNFFLSSQDYLYDVGLTPFAEDYLHILNFVSDVAQTTVTGLNEYAGLGPYSLSYPFTNYSDTVNPNAQGAVAFSGNQGNAAVSYAGSTFNTVFLGYPFEAIPGLADRSAVMDRTVTFFGGCEPPIDVSITPPEQTKIGSPGMQVSYVYTITNDANVEQEVLLSIDSLWPTEAPATAGVLPAGASTTIPVTVTIPINPDVIIAADTFTLLASGSVGGIDTATGTTNAVVNPGGEVLAPDGQSGIPLEVVSYEFQVTNTGDYTDSFNLQVSGLWTATLPGGDNTGPLAPGETTSVTVWVTVPAGAADGEVDVTTLTITSVLDPLITASAEVTTTATVPPPVYTILMPIIRR
jgi:hypothetical protein